MMVQETHITNKGLHKFTSSDGKMFIHATLLMQQNVHSLNIIIDKNANISFKPICERICDALRNLLSFVQFKKREKHLWRSVTFSKVAEFRF